MNKLKNKHEPSREIVSFFYQLVGIGNEKKSQLKPSLV